MGRDQEDKKRWRNSRVEAVRPAPKPNPGGVESYPRPARPSRARTKGLPRRHLGARSPRTPPRARGALTRQPASADGATHYPGSNYPLPAPRPVPLPKKGPCGARPAPGKEGGEGGAAVSPALRGPPAPPGAQRRRGLGAGSRRATGRDPAAGETGAPAGDPAQARPLRPPRPAGTRAHPGRAGSARPQPSPPSGCPEPPLRGLGAQTRVKGGPRKGRKGLQPTGTGGSPGSKSGPRPKVPGESPSASPALPGVPRGRSSPHLWPGGPAEASPRASHGRGPRPAGPSWDPLRPPPPSLSRHASALEEGPPAGEGVGTGRKLRLGSRRAGAGEGCGKAGAERT